MSRQVITESAPPETSPALRAWAQLLRGHAATTRLLSAELQEHGLTINDYEALSLLSEAEGGRLKRVELARRLVLTPSGVTRLLEGLEAAGLVERAACPADLRVVYAQLTELGRDRLVGGLVRARRLGARTLRGVPHQGRTRDARVAARAAPPKTAASVSGSKKWSRFASTATSTVSPIRTGAPRLEGRAEHGAGCRGERALSSCSPATTAGDRPSLRPRGVHGEVHEHLGAELLDALDLAAQPRAGGPVPRRHEVFGPDARGHLAPRPRIEVSVLRDLGRDLD